MTAAQLSAAQAELKKRGRGRLVPASGLTEWKPPPRHQGGATSVFGERRPAPRRGAHPGLLFAAALVSILTTIGIVISLLRDAIEFFGDVPLRTSCSAAPGRRCSADRSPASGRCSTGPCSSPASRSLVAIPLGLRTADLPGRVRPPARAQDGQAGARAARRRPDDRLRLLRADVLHADDPARLPGDRGRQSSTRCPPGIIMGFLVLPTIASVAEDAMSAVPQALREGAFGLGATKLQVSLRVVFPAALSGIVAAIVLGVSRAIGETMIVLIAAGQVPNSRASTRSRRYQTMAAFIAATAHGDIPTGSIDYKTIFAVGIDAVRLHADPEPDLDPASSASTGRSTNDRRRPTPADAAAVPAPIRTGASPPADASRLSGRRLPRCPAISASWPCARARRAALRRRQGRHRPSLAATS